MVKAKVYYKGKGEFEQAAVKAVGVGNYFEFGGGLGDIFNGSASTPLCRKLDLGEEVAVSLLTHNPNSWEVFAYHPNADKLSILMLPITELLKNGYNRHDLSFRERNGLPMNFRDNTRDNYPYKPFALPYDLSKIEVLRPPFVTFAVTASAGPQDFRSLPPSIINPAVETVVEHGFKAIFIGKNYNTHVADGTPPGIHIETSPPKHPMVVSMIDELTVNGNCEVMKRSVFTIACDSSMGCANRAMWLPGFHLACDKMWKACKAPPEGHCPSAHNSYQCSFGSFSKELLVGYIKKVRP